MNEIGYRIEELVQIVDRLRGPNGCPWDREQTNQSLIPYFIEEVYEVLESIDENNWDSLKEELGDTLLHIIFQASIAEEDKKYLFELRDKRKFDYETLKYLNQEPYIKKISL